MNVLIIVDSEGQACITRESASTKKTWLSRIADKVRGNKMPLNVYGTIQAQDNIQQATRETASVIEAAKSLGAKEILLHNGGFIRGAYPSGLTFRYSDLPQGIKISLGGTSLKNSANYCKFDCAILLGKHAMAGHKSGVMAHTYSSVAVKSMTLNDRPVGEIGIETTQLNFNNIPVIMVAGDDAACSEAKEFIGDVELAPVKKGISCHAAISMHPKDACNFLYEKTLTALNRLSDFHLIKTLPEYYLEVSCIDKVSAKNRAHRKNGKFLPPSSYSITTDNPWHLG